MKYWRRLSLGKQILVGIFGGILIGLITPKGASVLAPVGEVFLRLLKMLMVPLVFFSITGGVTKMQSAKQLYSVGVRFLIYILLTSGCSAALGLGIGTVLRLGSGTTEFLNDSLVNEAVEFHFMENVISWIPENIVKSMAEAEILSVGAPGVKGAGIVMTTVLLETIGMPLTLMPVLAAIWPVLG